MDDEADRNGFLLILSNFSTRKIITRFLIRGLIIPRSLNDSFILSTKMELINLQISFDKLKSSNIIDKDNYFGNVGKFGGISSSNFSPKRDKSDSK